MTLATIAAPPDSNSSLLLLSSKLCRAIKIRELTILGITTAFPSPGSLLFIFSSPFWRQFGWGSLWSPSDVSDDAGVEISPPWHCDVTTCLDILWPQNWHVRDVRAVCS